MWTAECQVSLCFTIFRNLLKFVFIESVMSSNHFILCCPLLLLPLIFLSIRIFSNESALCIRWPKYWSFSISPSNECSELISSRIDWFDLLAVHGVAKSWTRLSNFHIHWGRFLKSNLSELCDSKALRARAGAPQGGLTSAGSGCV